MLYPFSYDKISQENYDQIWIFKIFNVFNQIPF